MTSEEIFSMAIGVRAPWKITSTELQGSTDGKRKEMHINVDFEVGSEFDCPVCGQSCKAYDTTIRTWRHLNFFSVQVLHTCKSTESRM